MTKQDMLQPQAKQQLIGLLKEEQCFWSYSPDSIDNISDDILIEKVLLYLAPHTGKIIDAVAQLDCIRPYWLVGGTALSLQLHTRQSEDLDFQKWRTSKDE